MWNYVGWIITPNADSVARTCATWPGRNITPLCCAWTRMWFHAFPVCLLIGFVAHDLHNSVLVLVCRLFVPHCEVDAYSTHAGHASIMVAPWSSSHLRMKLTSLWLCINIFEMYDYARIRIHPLSCTPSLILSAQF